MDMLSGTSNIDTKTDTRTQEEIFKEWFDKGIEPHNMCSNPRVLQEYSEFYARYKNQ